MVYMLSVHADRLLMLHVLQLICIPSVALPTPELVYIRETCL